MRGTLEAELDVLCTSCRRVNHSVTPESAVVCACGKVVRARRPEDVAIEHDWRSQHHDLRQAAQVRRQHRNLGRMVALVVALGVIATVAGLYR